MRVPAQLMRAMAAEAEAAREARAKVMIMLMMMMVVIIIQRWKNVHTLQTRLCYSFSLAVLICWFYVCKLAKTLCY